MRLWQGDRCSRTKECMTLTVTQPLAHSPCNISLDAVVALPILSIQEREVKVLHNLPPLSLFYTLATGYPLTSSWYSKISSWQNTDDDILALLDNEAVDQAQWSLSQVAFTDQTIFITVKGHCSDATISADLLKNLNHQLSFTILRYRLPCGKTGCAPYYIYFLLYFVVCACTFSTKQLSILTTLSISIKHTRKTQILVIP